MAETYFTTGRFAESEKMIQALLTNPQIEAEQSIPLLAIQIADLATLEKTALLHTGFAALRETLSSRPESFRLTRSFEGSKQFIRLNAKLASHREWLTALFDALGGKDRGEIQRLPEKVK